MTGHRIDLLGDRAVWVGHEGDRYVLCFTRPEPEAPTRQHETVVNLSREAFEALAVLCYHALERGDTALAAMVLARANEESDT